MPRLEFTFSYKINKDLPLSVSDIKSKFLTGINLEVNGQSIDDETIEWWIESAFDEVENFLAIKLNKQVIQENKQFVGTDWQEWGFLKTTYFINCPISLEGYLGKIRQINYPKQWLSVRKTNDDKTYSRILYLVPNTNAAHSDMVIFSGVLPYLKSYGSWKHMPDYWNITYVTGFNEIPKEIVNAIGKLVSLQILTIANEMFMQQFGAGSFGISNKSVSIDGLSQSTGTYVNGQSGIFGARIKQYKDELYGDGKREGELDRLKNYFSDLIMTTA